MYGVLDRFTGFHIASEAGPHRRYETRRTSEQTTLVVARQHDHHRIGARKVLGFALWAIAPPSARYKPRCGAAVRAKAVARVPVQHGLGFGDRRQVIGSDEALHRN